MRKSIFILLVLILSGLGCKNFQKPSSISDTDILQTPVISLVEFEDAYSTCLSNTDVTGDQRQKWKMASLDHIAACQQEDKTWVVVTEENELASTYRVHHLSSAGDLIAESEEVPLCGGPIALPRLNFKNRELTCARLSGGCGGAVTWNINLDNKSVELRKIGTSEFCVD